MHTYTLYASYLTFVHTTHSHIHTRTYTHSITARSWYERLQRWEMALEGYEREQLEQPNSMEVGLGRLRCLKALHEWPRMMKLGERVLRTHSHLMPDKQSLVQLLCLASWKLRKWDSMKKYLTLLKTSTYEGAFYSAVAAIHSGTADAARTHLDKLRGILDVELVAVFDGSYSRAYPLMVQAQQVSELEEVLLYRTCDDDTRRSQIRAMWNARLYGCLRHVDVWEKILSIRSLVLEPRDEVDVWVNFSSIARENNRLALSKGILTDLLGFDPRSPQFRTVGGADADVQHCYELPLDAPKVSYAYLKHLWSVNEMLPGKNVRAEPIAKLTELVSKLEARRVAGNVGGGGHSDSQMAALLAKCHNSLGRWTEECHGLSAKTIPVVLGHFDAARTLNKDSG